MSEKVRIDTLKAGDTFTPAYGGHYTYRREDGALSGVHHVEKDDGRLTAFAGCAEVVIGWHEKGWLQR